ncbi:MOSC domain-containing protein [Brevibacillus sp. NPDC058079]|uniref:MOSC domain-containing protein n=1 Tax=Brevibacillus sp. NPDC058079 TaxID=3346330 RepID=UPI0036EBE2F3
MLFHGKIIWHRLFTELQEKGFTGAPGQIGENITTEGVDLLALPTGTKLTIGKSTVVELTGLRNPCTQLDNFQPGLMAAVLDREQNGNLIRKAGVMGIVLIGGEVFLGDEIKAQLPPKPYKPLDRV